jgi:hypothetical protein
MTEIDIGAARATARTPVRKQDRRADPFSLRLSVIAEMRHGQIRTS